MSTRESVDPKLIALAMLANGALTGATEQRFFDRLPPLFRDRINYMTVEPSAAAIYALIQKIGPEKTLKALDHFESYWTRVPQELRDALRPLVVEKIQQVLGDDVEVTFRDKRLV